MTPDEILKELKRELGVRQSVYPRWVDQGKLTQKTADHRIAAIAEAIALIESIKPVQSSLFDEVA